MDRIFISMNRYAATALCALIAIALLGPADLHPATV